MGQTLTHGIYLPDEGERNCYAGLAGNWQLLDSAVGTVAEHTSALSGKAPLVHTHTKSDVTDLFNSANTWSGENTFSAPCKTLGKKLLTNITDLDDAYYNGEVCGFNPNTLHNPTNGYGNVLTINNAVNVPDNIYSSWITQIAASASGGYLGIRNRSNGGAWTSWTRILTEDHAVPTVTNTYDLGSSSYQWNNLYAKNYYYNGVAWGLDKLNTWSAVNQYSREIQLAGDRNAFIAPMWEGAGSGIAFLVSDASKAICFGVYTDDTNNNNRKIVDGTKGRMIIRTGEKDSESYLEVEPKASNARLGNSSNKWKTLNGINPGALSLPGTSHTDIKESITDRNYGANFYTAPSDGYVCIGCMASSLQISNDTLGFSTTGSTGQDGYAAAYIPVRTGNTVRIQVNQTSTDYQYFSFYPCAGNV